jgi:hypothetical protein
MYAIGRLRASRALLALACGLALLAPGAVGQATGGAAAHGSLRAVPTDDLGQAQLRDRGLGPLVGVGARRDDRERPGPALPGVLAATLAVVGALMSRRRDDRPARRAGGPAAGARAPPSLQPAPT